MTGGLILRLLFIGGMLAMSILIPVIFALGHSLLSGLSGRAPKRLRTERRPMHVGPTKGAELQHLA